MLFVCFVLFTNAVQPVCLLSFSLKHKHEKVSCAAGENS